MQRADPQPSIDDFNMDISAEDPSPIHTVPARHNPSPPRELIHSHRLPPAPAANVPAPEEHRQLAAIAPAFIGDYAIGRTRIHRAYNIGFYFNP